MARKAASSSRSKVEYHVSVADDFLLKKARGAQDPSSNCCKTAPTYVAEASTARARVAEGALRMKVVLRELAGDGEK